MAKRSRCPAENPMVAGSIPGRDIFSFWIFHLFPSLQLGRALANEMKHDNSPVGIVVLDPRFD